MIGGGVIDGSLYSGVGGTLLSIKDELYPKRVPGASLIQSGGRRGDGFSIRYFFAGVDNAGGWKNKAPWALVLRR